MERKKAHNGLINNITMTQGEHIAAS